MNPHDGPVTIDVIIPFLKMRKLRLREINNSLQLPARCGFKLRVVGLHSFHIRHLGQEGGESIWLHGFWCETMYRTFIWSYWQTAFRFMSYIPKFPLLVLSNYLPYCVDSQSKRVDTDARKDFPSSIKLNDVSLLGYMKPDKE